MACTTQPPSEVRMKLAVHMRRGGSTWKAVAERLGCSEETVRKWPLRYRERWQEEVRKNAVQAVRSGEVGAVTALQAVLRDDREAVRLTAAISLLKMRMQHSRDEFRARIGLKTATLTVKTAMLLLARLSVLELKLVSEECLQLAEALSPVRPSCDSDRSDIRPASCAAGPELLQPHVHAQFDTTAGRAG